MAIFNEHVNLFGFQKLKILSRVMEEFPGRYHYHQRTKVYRKDLFAGKVKPYIFHMSWTSNKIHTILFFRQMGEWYVCQQAMYTKECGRYYYRYYRKSMTLSAKTVFLDNFANELANFV
jgi:hypothetical protein